MKTLSVANAAEWRRWLAKNHNRENEIWLIYDKKGSNKISVDYHSSVEEALCFGWIDSIIKKLNEDYYARKFTPRKDDSVWSASNKQRVEKLIAEKRMTDVGLTKVQAAKKSGMWDKEVKCPRLDFEPPPEFLEALNSNDRARRNFEKLAKSYQKPYIIWISMAKRVETRKKRIAEAISLLEKGEKLGLK